MLDLDFNNDGVIDASDLVAITDVVESEEPAGKCVVNGLRCDSPDFNRDGDANSDDLAAFSSAIAGTLGGTTTYFVPSRSIAEYRFLYRGYWYDQRLGIYHVRHRAYDPHIQRWLQPDPAMFVDGLNRYAYCGNRPFSLYDPMGLYWREMWDGVLSVVEGNPGGVFTWLSINNERERQQAQLRRTIWINPNSDVSYGAEAALKNARQISDFADTSGNVAATIDTSARLAFPSADAADGIATAVDRAIKNSTAMNVAAIPLLVAIEILPGKSPAGSHWLLRKETRATGDQANHVLQNAVFGDVIDRDVGISIWLNGNAHDIGSEHYKFHKVLDDFLEPFMRNGPKHGTSPTIKQYLDKMAEALRATGRYTDDDIDQIVRSAEKQLDDHGLKLGDDIPRVPGGRATPKCSSGS